MTRLLPLLLLCACLAEPTPREPIPDVRAINVAVQAWEDAGRAYTQRCAETRQRILISARATEDVLDICNPDTAGIVVGCFVAPRTDAAPLIVVTTDPALRTDVVVHEAMHWLLWCSEGDADSDHVDSEVWDEIYWLALSEVIP